MRHQSGTLAPTGSYAIAWSKYAALGRGRGPGTARGINVFLRGRRWDLGSDGPALGFIGGDITQGLRTPEGATTLNLWL